MIHSPQSSAERRLAIEVRGVAQGVGFRPFIFNIARSNSLSGWVRNEADLVRIEVQGNQAALDEFLTQLRDEHPPQARIDELIVQEAPCAKDQPEEFEIRTSLDAAVPGPTIPADLATCADCLAEIRDPTERRYGYPFTNCTNCGPRWSIIDRLPYDRARTSMANFAMCAECRREYENPLDRRFHAQPIACPKCGPHLELLACAGNCVARGEEAITLGAAMLLEGCVLALKGLGGYQLAVDATAADAVARLRERKKRPDRPFALMLASLDEARQYCEVSAEEAKMLASHQSPIVLLKKRLVPGIAKNIAPGNPYLGVMLPYTPLHYLLMDAVNRPIVCTSGNLSEDPMAIELEDALARLGTITDVFLVHNRPIVRPVDDSIVRLGPCGFQVLRRARGYAPLPLRVKITAPTILAVGAHLKNTVAVCLENAARERALGNASVIISSHIGDLDNLLSLQVFQRAIKDMVDFFAVKPKVVVCDLHPDYASTREAESLASEWDAKLLRVQHHHAHVAAAMAEHDLQGPVLGLAWDGTGFGPDGTIWGGEALRCQGAESMRVAHLRTFALPGGDQAAREPRRSALAVLFEIFGNDGAKIVADWFSDAELNTIVRMLEREINAPRTSSMGRLFDAIAALCGLPRIISFEGQAAMALEFAADENEESAYQIPLRIKENQPIVADWEPMLRSVLDDRSAGVSLKIISARFHNSLAQLAVDIATSIQLNTVLLTGGCFQNALLTKRVYNRLQAAGFSVYAHRKVPPGDGGIALGQIYVAALGDKM
ncbi:MAG: carbamoyltransferase HypF [Thermoguttaceae bacterium]